MCSWYAETTRWFLRFFLVLTVYVCLFKQCCASSSNLLRFALSFLLILLVPSMCQPVKAACTPRTLFSMYLHTCCPNFTSIAHDPDPKHPHSHTNVIKSSTTNTETSRGGGFARSLRITKETAKRSAPHLRHATLSQVWMREGNRKANRQ
jgi:hypothetical protein